jgi:hypothetical protein
VRLRAGAVPLGCVMVRLRHWWHSAWAIKVNMARALSCVHGAAVIIAHRTCSADEAENSSQHPKRRTSCQRRSTCASLDQRPLDTRTMRRDRLALPIALRLHSSYGASACLASASRAWASFDALPDGLVLAVDVKTPGRSCRSCADQAPPRRAGRSSGARASAPAPTPLNTTRRRGGVSEAVLRWSQGSS